MPICSLCDEAVDQWIPATDREASSPAVRVLEIVGASSDANYCPNCGADDRERHAWLYLSESGILDQCPGGRALHVGAEPRLRERLASLPLDWTFTNDHDIGADNFEGRFEAHAFQLVLCNRVLSRVPDLAYAIRALAASVNSSGWFIAQSEYSPLLKFTLEFMLPPSKAAAHLFFGDECARRLLGANWTDALLEAGLRGKAYEHELVLQGFEEATWGVNPREPFVLFSAEKWPTFQS